jgi:hypothetical protein
MDDLDAFFDDVDAVAEKAREEDEEGKKEKTAIEVADESSPPADQLKEEERPAKKQKVETKPATTIVAKKTTVVAVAPSSAAVTSVNDSSNQGGVTMPPQHIDGQHQYQYQQHQHQHHQQHQPYSAPGSSLVPPPPLPPPLPPLPPGPPPPHPYNGMDQQQQTKVHKRTAGSSTWEDPTLAEFPPNDFRLFVGNLPKEIRNEQLAAHFSKYASFAMARICFNKSDGKSRGFGFISVMDPKDCARALREMDQSWLGSRPIKVKRSEWKEREQNVAQKRNKKERKRGQFGL